MHVACCVALCVGKRRIIHDATHGTKVSNRIRCRDKVRSPSAREKQYLLAYFKQKRSLVFSLVGDISKAHRRLLHSPDERGLSACRITEDDEYIYINRVGTFGLACASYWWSRIAGAGVSLVHELLGPKMPVELLIFADDLEALAADTGGRRGITLSFLFLSVLGFPFKWAKQRGGLRVEQDGKGEILQWFSEEITVDWADWLLYKKDPKRVIATLELLATLAAVQLWMPQGDSHVNATCWLRGKTDNLGNTFAVSKWMSTKFPVTIFVMELAETLRLGKCSLMLDWLKRDDNQLADDLTNLKFDKFDAGARVRWKPHEQKWQVLSKFMEHAKSFHNEMKTRKLEVKQPEAKRRKLGKALSPW
eukprot:s193_g12.t1